VKSYITGLNPQPLGAISSSNNGLMYNYFRSEAATDPCSVSKVIVNKAVKAKKKKVIKRVYPSQLLFIKKPVKVSNNCYADIYPIFRIIKNARKEQSSVSL
jgi:hypothetical protein